ncbi:MAG TPA: hypothetical protein VIM65_02400 [Cyclobacteriaceae bacterium]
MKTISAKLFLICLVIIWGCGHKEHDHHEEHEADSISTDANANAALLDEVDKLHMELMGKMEDIYKKKEELQKELDGATDDKKKELENAIAKLDSADQSMMDWMHNFKPLPDSVGTEKAREYLETEMEKIKKVKDDILEALDSK